MLLYSSLNELIINLFLKKIIKLTISRALRETLFTQGQIRSLSDSEFEFYKKKSSYHCERNETVLISNHPNEIDSVVDLETLNSLKDFSLCVINLEDKIKDKNLELQKMKEKIQEELSQLIT